VTVTLERPVLADPRPLEDWPGVGALLVGTQVRLVTGSHSTHRVIEVGEGEPLILIHGIGGHAECWARNWHALAGPGLPRLRHRRALPRHVQQAAVDRRHVP
jgi:2-hydroxy-6-oxonona-2,4-dienedioate hydrolase/2-hydroxy-6-oxo-6-(2'-carboxyphenyl)-hexa-2,4-dienoate hydrolase